MSRILLLLGAAIAAMPDVVSQESEGFIEQLLVF